MKALNMVSISIVSHAHGPMVAELISQLLEFPEISKIIVTKNIPEVLSLPVSKKIELIENILPCGFGENHNSAFKLVTEDYFCVLNPDIKFISNPFTRLIEDLRDSNAQLVAPMVLNCAGGVEDSVRYFPTISSVIKRLIFKNGGQYRLRENDQIFSAEWVAGMFMLFRSPSYKKLNGFDERFFLYYEDVDICIRLWRAGLRLIVDPSVSVIHDARRASRVNFFHMKLHLKSMMLYFARYFCRLPSLNSNFNDKL